MINSIFALTVALLGLAAVGLALHAPQPARTGLHDGQAGTLPDDVPGYAAVRSPHH
ncbi:hypothetical protein [Streptomyces chartreusis]|uniref:hypothetical protein n=1 Tax=Streptomyces chartreusis TaxID=1969 RepID=UPI002F90FEFD|nr:hypothetical protein OG938_44420 [Streptomyces chartreusis]